MSFVTTVLSTVFAVYRFRVTARLESVRKKLTLLPSINVALRILAISEPFRRFDRPIIKRSRGCGDEGR
jgi:hypothetical protein